jgi:hypothetical protein
MQQANYPDLEVDSFYENSAYFRLHLLMWGVICICFAAAMYLLGVVMVVPRALFHSPLLLAINEWIVWYSGVPLVLGMLLAGLDLFLLLGRKRSTRHDVRCEKIGSPRLIVALTAYNDEESISAAVADFKAHPLVDEVIVVSNNSVDATFARAKEAGATAVNEAQPGYGRCVWRCFTESVARNSELIVLCEGDRTFRAYDLDKLVSFIGHADIVNGTRTVERLRARDTQLSTFMYYGNLFVGKILEAKHLGRSTVTDVGTTFKLCRRDALVRLMPHLDPAVNLEFNAHFLDIALGRGLDVVECPITFHPRVGISKGGNVNNGRALRVGVRMLLGVIFGWKALAT